MGSTRIDGWTAARRQIFLDHFAAHGSVGMAVAAAGPSASSFYRLCRRDAGFAARWQEVVDARWQALMARRHGISENPSRASTPALL